MESVGEVIDDYRTTAALRYSSPIMDTHELQLGSDEREDADNTKQEPQPQHDSERTSHQPDRMDMSAEALQLAAQLSEGLAPMMQTQTGQEHDAAAQHGAAGIPQSQDYAIADQAQDQVALGDSQHDTVLHNTDPRLQDHITQQNHHLSQHHDQEHVPPRQDHGVRPPQNDLQERYVHDNDNLQAAISGMTQNQPNTGLQINSQAGPHHHTLPQQAPQVHHGYIAQLAQQAYAHSGRNDLNFDNTPPRKRTKVSRACDECRRKKIKCEAVSEAEGTQCPNCRRTQTECQFSRVPQKRGPSKGYIKELADRIQQIEGKLGAQALETLLADAAIPRRESSDAFPPSAQVNENGKRPSSTLESSVERQVVTTVRPRASLAETAEPKQNPNVETEQPDLASLANAATMAPVDDVVFEAYKAIIHPTLCFLPGTKSIFDGIIAHCPPLLREAAVEALAATIRSFGSEIPSHDNAKKANQLLWEWQCSEGLRNNLSHLVQLQTLLLLAIEADNHGPSALQGQHGGPSKSMLLSMAYSTAQSMGLPTAVGANAVIDGVSDTASGLTQRAWWSLVVLDRWNALATGSQPAISQNLINVTSDLAPILGDGLYNLITLTHIFSIALQDWFDPIKAAQTGVGRENPSKALEVGINLLRLTIPGALAPEAHPCVQLAVAHLRLMHKLLQPNLSALPIVKAAGEIVGLLADNPDTHSPFNHHFVSLASLALVCYAGNTETREDAARHIEELNGEIAPSTWNDAVRARIGSGIMLLNQQSEGASVVAFDIQAMLRQGCLNEFPTLD